MQRFFLIFLILITGAFFAQAQTVTEQTEMHVVKKGETLYHLSQIYNTTVSHLLDLNPTIVNNKLETGASVKVPHVNDRTAKTVKIGPPQYLTPVTYLVAKGETLYSISKKTNNEVETVRMWNDLKNDDIKAGQKIIVGYTAGANPKKGTTTATATAVTSATTTPATATIAKPQPKAATVSTGAATASSQPITTPKTPTATTTPIKTNVSKTVTPVQAKPEAKTPAANAAITATVPTVNPKPVITNKEEGKLTYISEKGVATWSKGNNDDGQFYALHPTAPVGTVITIKNMMNNSSVQVKVIGKLPNTAENQNVMIKLSGSAAKQLNVLDDKFLATINYMGVKGE